jgi:diguanylate cyclase (GGDEF)-like protein
MDMDTLTGEFASRSTEAAFLDHKQPQTRSLLGYTLVFCGLFYLGFCATDLAALGAGPEFARLLAARVLVAATAGACAWLAYRRPLTVRATRLAATVSEATALACFMFIAVHRPAEFHWHAMSLAIMVIVIYLYIPNRLAYALALAAASTAVFLALAWRMARMSDADVITMGMLLFLANTFGLLAARRFNQVSRDEFRLRLDLKHAAERDHLTGCYNRRYLHEHLMAAELARAQRFRHDLTVVLCDIDHFKQINDTHGHADGDAVLRRFAGLLREMTRDQVDSVVRYGGEEFLAILPDTDLDGGVRLAERLRTAFAGLEIHGYAGGAPIRASASFGVATVRFDRMPCNYTLRDLITSADQMMYEAKHRGRNRVESVQLR